MVKLKSVVDANDWLESEFETIRRLALFSVAISTLIVVSCITFIPLCYEHVQRLQSSMTVDVILLKVTFLMLFLIFSSFFFLCFYLLIKKIFSFLLSFSCGLIFIS